MFAALFFGWSACVALAFLPLGQTVHLLFNFVNLEKLCLSFFGQSLEIGWLLV